MRNRTLPALPEGYRWSVELTDSSLDSRVDVRIIKVGGSRYAGTATAFHLNNPPDDVEGEILRKAEYLRQGLIRELDARVAVNAFKERYGV